MLDNAQMALAKSDMRVFRAYRELAVDDRLDVLEVIQDKISDAAEMGEDLNEDKNKERAWTSDASLKYREKKQIDELELAKLPELYSSSSEADRQAAAAAQLIVLDIDSSRRAGGRDKHRTPNENESAFQIFKDNAADVDVYRGYAEEQVEQLSKLIFNKDGFNKPDTIRQLLGDDPEGKLKAYNLSDAQRSLFKAILYAAMVH